jgi:hypothetical protein
MAQDKIKPLQEVGVTVVESQPRLALKCLKFSSSVDG